MGRGVGYGKVIIFGEHFVVYGAPGLAGGIANAAVVEVKKADKNKISTEQTVITELSLQGIAAVLGSMGIKDNYGVHLSGDLPTYGGLGSSAAFCVALTRAIAEDRHMGIKDEEVNRHAYEGEKTFHGNPSGIDNVMATYGGVVEFRRGPTMEESRFERLTVKKPLDIVVAFTGKYSPTPKMIEAVGKFKEQDEEEFKQLMDEYVEIEMHGRHFIEKGKIDEIGRLMNANQTLLEELGVSHELNDRIIKTANEAGALGSKLTGGGGGGCCIALAKDRKHAEEIREKLKEEKFESFHTQIGR